MNKNKVIQILLILLAILILIISFNFYKKNKESLSEKFDKIDNVIDLTVKDSTKTIIEDINYYSKDGAGNEFEINSSYGRADLQNTNIINMEDVTAEIKLVNSDTIYIYSKYAKYNNISYETDFSENVKILYIDHVITGDNLKLFFQENLISIFNNVTYKHSNSRMSSDKIEINTITKKMKIFMYNKADKVKFLYK
jgi:lipopolysaccharide export system protein LptA|tara:strand:+ start:357 stop:944 length:588 start_codon:yes stop_codon:yes gene_type:complete